jgi:glycosyltransferase involved in cell wall biosynthesis
MTTPKFTVTLGSNRPGGIDIALAGLVNQTYPDFEVVFVDGLYHERHEAVLDAVAKSGLKQPFFHVPNHRYSKGIWGTPCAGYNTGFMLATGEFIVMLIDYGYAPPTWLEAHLKAQARPKVVMGPHEYRTLEGYVTKDGGPVVDYHARNNVDGREPEVVIEEIIRQRGRFDMISVFKSPFLPEHLSWYPREASDAKCEMPTGPLSWLYFNTKNESFPREAVLNANGMDENYDLGRGPGDPDLGLRLARQNLDTWNVKEAIVHCLNPRRIMPNINIVIPEGSRLPPPHDARWYIEDGYKYFNGVKSSGAIKAPNPYDIRKKREEIFGWRELSALREAVIPMNVVEDAEYWKGV